MHKRALQQLDGTAQLHSHDDLLRQASSRAPNFLVPSEHRQLTPGLSGGASSRCSPRPARVASPGRTVGALPAYCAHSEAGPQMLELRPRQGPGPCLLHWALEELLVTYGWEARLPFSRSPREATHLAKGASVNSEGREPGGSCRGVGTGRDGGVCEPSQAGGVVSPDGPRSRVSRCD